MSKKIKKRSNIGNEYVDPNLEEVEEDRGFEVELDEDTNEIVFVHHYRRKWGDEIDADMEHVLNMEESVELVGMMVSMIESVKNKLLMQKAMSTPIPVEGNPAQGPQHYEGK